MAKNILFALLFAVSIANSLAFECPDAASIQPCKCIIHCETFECSNIAQPFSLMQVTRNATISGKPIKFKNLVIYNTNLTSIGEDDLWGITIGDWEQVIIAYNRQLTSIHKNAFRYAQAKTLFLNSNALKSSTDLFTSYKTLDNVDHIMLMDNKLTSVPTHAFWSLNRIYEIYLNNNSISKIQKHAFAFNQSNHLLLEIWLNANNMSEEAFEIGSFSGTNQPTVLHLADNRLKHFDQKVFEPFLNEHKRNVMNVDGNRFACGCREKWLVARNRNGTENMWKRIHGFLCEDGRAIWDYDLNKDFKGC